MWLNQTYEELQETIKNGFSKSMMNYSTNKAHFWNWQDIMKGHEPNVLNGEAEIRK